MKQIHTLSLITAMLISGPALADKNRWKIHNTDQHTYIATVAMDFQGVNGPMLGVLTVEFDPNQGCRSGVELALFHGSGYGNPLGRISPPQTTPLNLAVDGRPIPIGDTYWIKYDNGFSTLSYVGSDVVSAIKRGTTAVAMMMSGTPKFEFPIAGADQAVGIIESECKTAMAKTTLR